MCDSVQRASVREKYHASHGGCCMFMLCCAGCYSQKLHHERFVTIPDEFICCYKEVDVWGHATVPVSGNVERRRHC